VKPQKRGPAPTLIGSKVWDKRGALPLEASSFISHKCHRKTIDLPVIAIPPNQHVSLFQRIPWVEVKELCNLRIADEPHGTCVNSSQRLLTTYLDAHKDPVGVLFPGKGAMLVWAGALGKGSCILE
jgi:hypothetical protein